MLLTPDVTGDGRGDLLEVGPDGTLTVRAGDGKGGFASPGTAYGRFRGKDLLTSVGDLNGDGRNDLVARNAGTGRLLAFVGHRDGSFGRVRLSTAWGGYDLLVGAGDVTGDGHPDLLARDTNGRMWLAPGTGTPRFGAKVQLPGNWSRYDVIAGYGDYDSDGHPDLFVRTSSDHQGYVLPGDGHGGFGHALGPLTQFANASGLAGGGDVLGTSDADLVAVRGDELLTYENSGDFDTGTPIDTGANFAQADKLMRAGDWNRDGYADVISRS